ncbi:MAG: MFS transporter, partial [Rudaea sp.]
MASISTVVEKAALPDTAAERTYRRRVWYWALYDVANHAYITTFNSTFFPTYFIAIAAPAFIALGEPDAIARDTASNYYAFVTSLALFIAALLAPVVGTYADITGARKRLLVVTSAVGAAIASAAFVLTTGMWVLGLAIYLLTQLAMNIALGLSSSLLPHVAREDDLNRVSSLGYAMGYVGGGVLLLLNVIVFFAADAGKLPFDGSTAVRIAFFSVGV